MLGEGRRGAERRATVAAGAMVEHVVRPTGLVDDPQVDVRPASTPVGLVRREPVHDGRRRVDAGLGNASVPRSGDDADVLWYYACHAQLPTAMNAQPIPATDTFKPTELGRHAGGCQL